MKKRHCESLCPKFQLAMDVLAKPWNGLIIATLESGPARFSELHDRLPAIGDRMLSDRLKELVARGLVARRVIDGPPVRVEYELTTAGRGFQEVSDAIARWGDTLGEQERAHAAAENLGSPAAKKRPDERRVKARPAERPVKARPEGKGENARSTRRVR